MAGAAFSLFLDFSNTPSLLLRLFNYKLQNFNSALNGYFKSEITSFQIASGLFALLFTAIASIIKSVEYKLNKKKSINVLRKIYAGDELELFLLDALTNGFMVSITLETNKCYIGWIPSVNPEDSVRDAIALIPAFSGYRNQENLELDIKRNYYSHYKNAGLLDQEVDFSQIYNYRVVIPLKKVAHASFFNPDVYKKLSQSSDSTPEKNDGIHS